MCSAASRLVAWSPCTLLSAVEVKGLVSGMLEGDIFGGGEARVMYFVGIVKS